MVLGEAVRGCFPWEGLPAGSAPALMLWRLDSDTKDSVEKIPDIQD